MKPDIRLMAAIIAAVNAYLQSEKGAVPSSLKPLNPDPTVRKQS
jgi:hypothetical protein